MKIKEFLKLNIAKVIIFILLMGGINYYIISTTMVLDARVLVGIPLGFYPIGSFGLLVYNDPYPKISFSLFNFIIDVIFWYLISCLIFYILNLIKKIK